MIIELDILGEPAPKGSSRAILIRGRAVNVPGGSNVNRTKLKSWDRSVREAALEALGNPTAPIFVQRPVSVQLNFRLTRPAGHWKADGMRLKPSAPIAPAGKPDIDKLARATIDSLIGLAFDDDSRIVSLLVTKRYAAPGKEGCAIFVAEYDPDIVITFSKRADVVQAPAVRSAAQADLPYDLGDGA